MTEDAVKDDAFDHKAFLRTLTAKPGIYQMFDQSGTRIYIGKARNLKNRVSSYFVKTHSSSKTRQLVSLIRSIEITITETENEALILENQLIKKYQPRYNVLLRDGKSYPYIFISGNHDYPMMKLIRGSKKAKGEYFGPYPSVGSLRETLTLLQKLFKLRPCEDSFFKNRSRPCLQYQIKRCSGPCVEAVSTNVYKQDVKLASLFLQGKSSRVIDSMVERMQAASSDLNYEKAAELRDQVAGLRRVQEKQHVSGDHGEVDVVTCAVEGGVACVSVFVVREGMTLGSRSFFPRIMAGHEEQEVLGAFLTQYYLGRTAPAEIITNVEVENVQWLTDVFEQQSSKRIRFTHRVRGERARWLKLALANTQQSLASRLSSRAGLVKRLEDLQSVFGLEEMPTRIECFDISHTGGEATVASCVVFGTDGPMSSDYRRFNISGITEADDYAAIAQAVQRRYKRLKSGEGKLPDLILIDGGKGQLQAAMTEMAELQLEYIPLIGVAKGSGRRPGLEQLFLPQSKVPIMLEEDSPALHVIQQIRDEAHRFAITGHRQRRAKARRESVLEGIPGMGPKRRQRLLTQFGGLQEVRRAGVEDLAKVQGISKNLAQLVYDAFHSESG